MSISNSLGLEWAVLQKNFEQYEMGGLVIKLAGLTFAAFGVAFGLNTAFVVVLLLVIWVQEGIYRTFQSRLGQRILRVERFIREATEDMDPRQTGRDAAYQLHSEWLAGRKGGVGLLAEYTVNACKPTVAYPYAVLIPVLITKCWLV